MKTIIVATDYSPAAQNALAYAAGLARYTGTKMILLNVFHFPVQSPEAVMPMHDIQELMDDNKARLLKVAEETARFYHIEVEAKTGTSLLKDELEELCHQYEEPLVVMGMRGESLERKVFGSLTTSVLKRGKFPVLVVPAEARFQEIAKILFACDHNCLSALHELKPLKELAINFRARIQIFHIERSPAFAFPEDELEVKQGPKLESIFRGIRHSYKEVDYEDIIEGIENGIKEYNADLLVMVPHKKGFWDQMLNRSKTREMALRSPIPLLSLPNPAF